MPGRGDSLACACAGGGGGGGGGVVWQNFPIKPVDSYFGWSSSIYIYI